MTVVGGMAVMADYRLFDPGVLAGILSPLVLFLGVITLGWAIHKTREAQAWKSAEQAAQEGWTVCRGRLEEANKWNAELDKRRLQAETVAQEREKHSETLTERLRVQDERVSQLLERTPEALWQAVENHSAEAAKHWAFERATLARLEQIAGDVETLLRGEGK